MSFQPTINLTSQQRRLTAGIFLVSLGDVASTLIGLNIGLVEMNPLIAPLLETSLVGFVAIKLAVPISLFLLAVKLFNAIPKRGVLWRIAGVRSPNVLAYIMIAAYGLITLNNFVALGVLLATA